MKQFFARFFATLLAILVAAVIIVLVKTYIEVQDRLATTRRHNELLKQQAEQLRKDNAKADEAEKPPPPEMITLTRDVPFQTASGILTLPVGTKLQFVSQTKTEVRARYLNTDYTIPIDFTDLLIQ